MRRTITILVLGLAALTVLAQNRTEWVNSDIVKPRIRVIIDNDFGGDPDGLFHLAQQLLSPSAEVRAVVWIGGRNILTSAATGCNGSARREPGR